MAVAAYAAVVSLIHVLDQIQHPAWHRLHLDRNLIQILREKVIFLQDFLELSSQIKHKEVEDLAVQISDVAVEAEDVIDTHVGEQLRALSADESGRALSLFCEDIVRVIEKMESIKKELMAVEEGMTVQEQQPRVARPGGVSAPRSSGKNTMVGFDERLVQIMDELTGYKCDLQILSIVGMGGIGKTTLARNVFDHPYIVHHFHRRAWVTISQEYSIVQVLLSLLQDLGVLDDQGNNQNGDDLYKLGEKLYKSLSGRKYLIVMDDLWSIEAWHDLKFFFPDNGNGSRVMATTRLLNVAISLGCLNPYLMDFLDEDQSWNLLCDKAFAQKGCPSELEEIGKNIAKNCKGLPLAIVAIGGLLSASNTTREYWEFVADNVNSFANLENNEHCLKILSLSYDNLPIHLKPCFLYMRVFPEDEEIPVYKLINLWIAEGFLKPVRGKSLEEVGEGYLKDLIDRNLILICKLKRSRKMKNCSIHDLLRDLCLRVFEKERFLRAPKVQTTCFPKNKDNCFLCNGSNTCTRIPLSQVNVASQATSAARCLVCHTCRSMYPQLNAVRLVSVDAGYMLTDSLECLSKRILQHPTKLQYLSLRVSGRFQFVCNSMLLFWNLQTIEIENDFFKPVVLPCEIWKMPQLRHLMIDYAILLDPAFTQIDKTDSTIILENLQTISNILNFRCSKEVVGRIPNMMKLKVYYQEKDNSNWSYYSLHNLEHLHKLESLHLVMPWDCFTLKMVVFPHSLKSLSLERGEIPWEEMTIIGSLSNLEVLELSEVCVGSKWNPVEGEFLKLKVLCIHHCDLECWGAEKDHFPNLESLTLSNMHNLKEIPSGIGEIETLQLIEVLYCNESVVNSAEEILEKQEDLGIEGLQLRVINSTFERVVRVPAISMKMDDIAPDDYSWTMYGRRLIKDSPYPREYYECNSVRGCPALKRVQRALDDPTMLIVAYRGEHNH